MSADHGTPITDLMSSIIDPVAEFADWDQVIRPSPYLDIWTLNPRRFIGSDPIVASARMHARWYAATMLARASCSVAHMNSRFRKSPSSVGTDGLPWMRTAEHMPEVGCGPAHVVITQTFELLHEFVHAPAGVAREGVLLRIRRSPSRKSTALTCHVDAIYWWPICEAGDSVSLGGDCYSSTTHSA